MSCCGNKRSNPSSLDKASKPLAALVQPRVFSAPVGIAPRGPEFEYLGGNVLTVTGQGTGLQYRFVGHGARVSIDPRDRASLARVPQLREGK